jgi:hypothetical protein
MSTASPLSSALWYAEHGLAVFPLRPGLKVPVRGTHGLLEASLDPRRINAWWGGLFAARNVGIATGGLVDVIDLDGAQGIATWEQAEDWPELIGMVATPHGRHLYIRPTGERSRAAIFPGVDYRGQGGYVVAPPSVLASGEIYRWEVPLMLEELVSR